MQLKRVQSLDKVASFIKENPVVSLDTETTGLNPRKDTLVDIVLGNPTQAIVFSPIFSEPLKTAKNTFIMHNAKFDLNVLYNNGIDLRDSTWFDTTILHHLLDENAKHSLDSIVQERYGDKYKEEFWAKHKSFEDASEEDRTVYACKDACYTAILYQDLRKDLKLDGIPDSLIGHAHKLARSLLDSEVHGIKIDLDYLAELGPRVKARIDDILQESRALVSDEIEILECRYWADELDKRKTAAGKAKVAKPEFNFSSSKQLVNLLYDRLELPTQYNKKRKPTVDDEALSKLESKHPIVEKIRDLRGNEKVYGTYVEGTIDRMENGRIYPSFNVNGTVTGRLSSSNPNMQQLPREGGIRGMYVPEPGHRFISADFGSLEVVVAAHYSQDKNLLKIIREGASKHDITAQSLGIDRQLAKRLNFAAQYLCGPKKMAEILGAPQKEAEYVYNRYWETYAGERRVIDECKKLIDDGLPIVNPFGRKRRFKKVFADKWEKERVYRQAYNAKIQGTGSDITHLAFYEVWERLRKTGFGSALFEVHDEIVASARDGREMAVKYMLEENMVAAGEKAGLSLPLTVEVSGPMDRWEKT